MKKYRIALYIRLSLEDAKTDSMSISSQRSILREYASELPEYANAELTEFVDNGYSGANFERPAVQELLDLVRANRIDCIMVKDFSRFGRNSLETGYFIERVSGFNPYREAKKTSISSHKKPDRDMTRLLCSVFGSVT